MADQLKIVTICGSLRKGSINHAVMKTLPSLAPPELSFSEAPSFADIPTYNYDVQSRWRAAASVNAWADAIWAPLRWRHHHLAGI